ncbi:AraC family transcriptional regulator [uncultured Bacteroides sp.]|uniref:helix-turn-helix domain-containing protein n=1 Tax=uncultured Bacteroides sp. TaxID=162156 RepID=UPI00260329B9|nr:helix-turn-helix domain-containing protein [uncultured Bacteroides sp.]
MKEENVILNLNLSDLSKQPGAQHIDNKLILIDNFDYSENEKHVRGLSFVNYPMKLSFTIAILIVSGGINVKINLEDFEAREGDAITVFKGNIGEFCSMLPDTRMAVIAFSDDFFNVVKNIDMALFIQQHIYTNPVLHLDRGFIDEALDIYRRMKSKLAETDNFFREGALHGYTQVLMYNAYNYFTKMKNNVEDTSEYNRNQEIYKHFMKAVQKNYMQERSITYYADLLCISPKYLSQVIKNVTGRLAGEWIRDYVILEAKALLKSNKYTVQQVCDMLNFANQSFFGKYFKKRTGMSPKAYMKS